MTGRKLFSPGVIAAYTVLANLPLGCLLYGLNLRARGQRRFGNLMLWVGIVGFVLLFFLAMNDALPGLSMLIGAAAAINVYKLEKNAFERDVKTGISPTPWPYSGSRLWARKCAAKSLES